MNTDTAQLDQRRDYRIPLSGQTVDAELIVGDRRILAHLRNESSGGFGLYVEGHPPVRKNDMIEISVRDGHYRCRVAYVRPCGDDSRIQVAQQDESGEIKTIVDLDDQERFCIGVERIEDLTYCRKSRRKSWISRILRVPPRVVNRCGQPITVLTLVACFAFPVVLFAAFGIALQFRFSEEPLNRSSSTTTAPTTVRRSHSTRRDQPTRPGPLVTRKAGHSTHSSTVTSRTQGVSIQDIYESAPTPSVEEVGTWIRNLLSKKGDEETYLSADVAPSVADRGPSSPASKGSVGVSLTPSQREAIEKLAQEAKHDLQSGVSPEEVKRELKTEIEAVLKEE